MVSASKTKNDPAAKTGWVPCKRGYELTQSTAIIDFCLKRLLEERIPVILYGKGYQSAITILFAIKGQKILIDRPRDWPGIKKALVVFKDAADIWNHFSVHILSESSDTLYIRKPAELFMLQRRKHFRIETPHESKAIFVYNKKKCKFKVENVSAGGILIVANYDPTIALHGKNIEKILITIPGHSGGKKGKQGEICFFIPESKIVRSQLDRQRGEECFGVRFVPEIREEGRILHYVRQRELQILRKGLVA